MEGHAEIHQGREMPPEIPSEISRFRLRAPGCRATDLTMKIPLVAILTALVLLPSCRKPKEVVVTETRRVTVKDQAPRLNASSDERFRNTLPSPMTAPTPEGWRQVPATEFRLLNYRFGDEGRGEVYVSVARGSLLDNLNRWLRQFNLEPIDQSTLETWGKVPVGPDSQGVWVEAQGTYAPGMGKPPVADQALAGIIAKADGGVLTIKMVGPKEEVEAQKSVLKSFAASAKWNQD